MTALTVSYYSLYPVYNHDVAHITFCRILTSSEASLSITHLNKSGSLCGSSSQIQALLNACKCLWTINGIITTIDNGPSFEKWAPTMFAGIWARWDDWHYLDPVQPLKTTCNIFISDLPVYQARSPGHLIGSWVYMICSGSWTHDWKLRYYLFRKAKWISE